MRRFYSSILMIVFCCQCALAQVGFKAKTGDSEFDATLSSLNASAQADLPFFKHEMSVSFGVPVPQIDKMILRHGLLPPELYLILEISKMLGKPANDCLNVYDKHKGKGWGVIAKEMGIKPGSAEFHALKNGAKGKNSKMKSKGKANKKSGQGNSGKGNKHSGKGNGNGNGNGNGKGKGKN